MANNGRAPNLFILGAPKCGTTSVASWLSARGDCFISDPKETFFWADELRPLAARNGITDRVAYDRLFSRCNQQVVGEATTLYLSSRSALGHLAAFQDAKFIVMLRKPQEVAQAFHMQTCFAGYEDVREFKDAWELQGDRLAGRQVPGAAIVPSLLQYKQIASLGSQLAKWIEAMGHERVLTLFIDDLRERPAEVAEDLQRFLGLKRQAFVAFPRENQAMVARSRLAIKILRQGLVANFSRRINRFLPTPIETKLKQVKLSMMRQNKKRNELPVDFKSELDRSFRSEIELIEELTKRPLSTWY